jgi:hypothetical protein
VGCPCDEDRCGQGLRCADDLCVEFTCEDSTTCESLICTEGICLPCETDEACEETGVYGTAARCIEGACVCPLGDEGCPCTEDSNCDRDLSCGALEDDDTEDVQSVCLVDPCVEAEPGEVEDCPCNGEGSCAEPLECLESGEGTGPGLGSGAVRMLDRASEL